MLAACERLDAVEIDRDLIALLREPGADLDGLTVHEGDVLRFDFRALARERGGRLRVVGNLPYNISTPLIFHLLDQIDAIADMHFMLQREVVERMAAAPGGGDYGRLTVMLAAQVEVTPCFTSRRAVSRRRPRWNRPSCAWCRMLRRLLPCPTLRFTPSW